MEARRLLYALAACSPAVLLALLGISGRFLVMPWQSPEYGSVVHREILAYRLPMMLEQSLADGEYSNSPETVQAVAQIWTSGWDKGALKNIPPASGMDFGGSGIRQQIEASRRRLMGMTLRASRALRDSGEIKRSADMLLVAMKLSEVMKYSSPVNTLQSSSMQSSCLHMYLGIADSLSDADQSAWKAEAIQYAPKEGEFSNCANSLGQWLGLSDTAEAIPYSPTSRSSRSMR